MINNRVAPKWQKMLTILTGAVLGLVLVTALQWGRPVLVPIAIAVLFTLLLSPVVQWFERYRIPHVLAVLMTVSLAAVALGGLGLVLGSQVTRMLAELPQNTETIKAKIRSLRQLGAGPAARQFGEMMDEITRELRPESTPSNPQANGSSAAADRSTKPPAGRPLAESVTSWNLLTKYLGSALEVLGAAAFAFVLIVFFLLEAREWRDRLVVLAGKARLSVTSKALQDINDRITRYLGMVAILNGGFGLLLAGMLFLLGLPYALLWGFVAGTLRFIPYIGPWMGAIFPITMSFALSPGWWQPFAVFGAVVVLELASNNVVEPFVFGRTTGVSPTALLISAGFWLFLWGPLGLVLSIPFAVCLVVIGKNIPELRFLNLILGDEPALTANASYYHRLLLGDPQEALAIVASHLETPESRNVYDELLIPALNSAKRDRRRNLITAEDYHSILESIRASLSQIDELVRARDDKIAPKDPTTDGTRLVVVGCPAVDDADRLALEMLQYGLKVTGRNFEIATSDESCQALVDQITENPPEVICIASIPPGDLATTRILCKRLRAAVPKVLIIVGRWGKSRANQTGHQELVLDGASFVHTTQTETCGFLRDHFLHSVL